MKSKIWIVSLIFCCILALSANEPVKYIFLFIGDGMGLPQRQLTEHFNTAQGKPGLLINRFPYQTVTATASANRLVTDSAAAATAIACGVKTNNGMLGITPDGTKVESVAAAAKKAGYRVGILTSVTLNHATPAGFYAHNSGRGNAREIALDLLASGFDFFGGGGVTDPKGDFFELATKKGYRVTGNREELNGSITLPAIAGDYRKGTNRNLSWDIDARPEDLQLAEITARAIELLDNPNGFFIMVEGGQIDHFGHSNDAGGMVREALNFDAAVRRAYEFAQKHPDDTLIVVTGDHETGGLALGQAGRAYRPELLARQQCSGTAFSRKVAAMLEADKSLSFDDLKPLITASFGLKFSGAADDPMLLAEEEQSAAKHAFEITAGRKEHEKEYTILYGKYDPLQVMLQRLTGGKAGVTFTTFGHTAQAVITSAYGKNAGKFTSAQDNTDISKLLKSMLSGTP